MDRAFYNQYREMILLLMQDYMNHDASDLRFPVLRSFDRYAGHSWAHGFGSFAEGNNLESTGEAINSWVAAYHIAQLENNQAMMDAAIYVTFMKPMQPNNIGLIMIKMFGVKNTANMQVLLG